MKSGGLDRARKEHSKNDLFVLIRSSLSVWYPLPLPHLLFGLFRLFLSYSFLLMQIINRGCHFYDVSRRGARLEIVPPNGAEGRNISTPTGIYKVGTASYTASMIDFITLKTCTLPTKNQLSIVAWQVELPTCYANASASNHLEGRTAYASSYSSSQLHCVHPFPQVSFPESSGCICTWSFVPFSS